jgi:hypothetical protein
LVDDTVVFAARIRQAKEMAKSSPNKRRNNFSPGYPSAALFEQVNSGDNGVFVKILEGFSHAFFNMVAMLPEARQAIRLTSDWYLDLFSDEVMMRGRGGMGGVSVDEESLLKRRREGLAVQHLEENVDFVF